MDPLYSMDGSSMGTARGEIRVPDFVCATHSTIWMTHDLTDCTNGPELTVCLRLKEGGDERHSDDAKKQELYRVLTTVPRTKDEDKVRKSLKQRLRELVFGEQPTEDQSQEGDSQEAREGDEALGMDLGDHQDHHVVEVPFAVEEMSGIQGRDEAHKRPTEVYRV